MVAKVMIGMLYGTEGLMAVGRLYVALVAVVLLLQIVYISYFNNLEI